MPAIRTYILYVSILLFTAVNNPLRAQSREKIDSLQQLTATANDTGKILLLLQIAHVYEQLDTDTAMIFSLMAKKESERIGFARGEGLSSKEIASAYYNHGDMPKAVQMSTLALEQLKNSGTVVEKADITNLIGLALMGQGKYYEAERYYEEALDLYRLCRDSAGVAVGLHNIGAINFYEGEYDEAIRYYITSLHLSETIRHKRLVAGNLLNIGMVFNVQKDHAKAKNYMKRAFESFRSLGDKIGEAEAIVHLGTAYYNEGALDSSLYAHQQALQLYREAKSDKGISQSLSNIGDILIENGNYKTAQDYYEESLRIRTRNDDRYGMAISYTGIAKVNYGLGNIGKAEAYYDSALTISKAIGTVWYTAEMYGSIAHLQEKLGNYKAAFEAMKELAGLKDTLFNREKMEVVQGLEARYESEKREKDLIIEKNTVQLLRKENRLFTITVWALCIIAALIVSLGILLYKRARIRELKNLEIAEKNRLLAETRQQVTEAELARTKAEQEKIRAELDFKRKELTQLALHINQQNEFLESLRHNLKTGHSEPGIRSLEAELETKLNLGKQRENFEANVDLINEDFYRRLQSRFPALTENEKKLCAMLRLNLSSKEIASVMNITSKSVDMNRYRLRKKLVLEGEADLVKFLSDV